MDPINMNELHPLMFNMGVILTLMSLVVFFALYVLWGNRSVSHRVIIGVLFVYAFAMVAVLLMFAFVNQIPIQEVFKMLFWFGGR